MFNGSLGLPELLLVLGIVLLVFGPKRLPTLGRQLGRGMREFKESITGGDSHDEDDEDDDAAKERATLTPASAREARDVPAEDVPKRTSA